MKILKSYLNGNHVTSIYEDGTKLRETLNPDDDVMTFTFAETVDVKITDCCDGLCPFCYEGSDEKGKHGNLDLPIFDSWEEGTELCLGGGNPFTHPGLHKFLKKMAAKGVICNITINQRHLKKYLDKIKQFYDEDLIHGIGVSVTDPMNADQMKDIDELEKIAGDKMVLHIIAGVYPMDDDALKILENRNVLILGYYNGKNGENYFRCSYGDIAARQRALSNKLPEISNTVKCIAFDNLALDQIDPKNRLQISDEEWKLIFQGDDSIKKWGTYPNTFFLDTVEERFYASSHTEEGGVKYHGQSFRETFKEVIRWSK